MRRLPIALGVASLLLVFGWAASGEARAADDAAKAYVDAYIDGLVELGLLTEAQADQLRAKAQAAAGEAAKAAPPPKKGWFDTTKVGGYLQFRWNDYPDHTGGLGDPENEFSVRRARLKVEGKPTDRLKTTLQVDVPVGDGVADLKDAFADWYLCDSHEWWLRVGQSKVPFGFEIPQSSSRRLPFERSDARRRMVPGERDLGGWIYYTPEHLHDRFDELKKHHLGPGDFGLIGLGLYQGQRINRGEANDDKHFAFRFDYPLALNHRLGQVGFSVFAGDCVTGSKSATVDPPGPPPPITATVPGASIDEHAWNFHFYLPPDPFGVQFEYLSGQTGGLFKPNPFDPNTWFIGKANVDGWYGQAHYSPCEDATLFVRYDEMDGWRRRGWKSLPTMNNMERWTFGFAYDLDSKSELTIEYEDVLRNGSPDDYFGIQWQYKY